MASRLTGWTHWAIGVYYGGISGAAISVASRRIPQAPPAQIHPLERTEEKLKKETTS
ncbi:MAG: hypothetical protein JXB10_01405 [Pirellulales bacterium]|nr:hypothetical protein [Pirellulales bacterium]